MNIGAFVISIAFATAVAAVAGLTSRHRGPFAFVVRRLRGTEASYVAISTMLWVVSLGIVGLAAAAAVYPEHAASYASWAMIFFGVAPGLAAAFRLAIQRHAP